MKYNCIEMHNNKNCLFGKDIGHKECDKINSPKNSEEKPCLDCDIYYYYWELKKEELRDREQRRKASARY